MQDALRYLIQYFEMLNLIDQITLQDQEKAVAGSRSESRALIEFIE